MGGPALVSAEEAMPEAEEAEAGAPVAEVL
jgi:hypothetical protein